MQVTRCVPALAFCWSMAPQARVLGGCPELDVCLMKGAVEPGAGLAVAREPSRSASKLSLGQ